MAESFPEEVELTSADTERAFAEDSQGNFINNLTFGIESPFDDPRVNSPPIKYPIETNLLNDAVQLDELNEPQSANLGREDERIVVAPQCESATPRSPENGG